MSFKATNINNILRVWEMLELRATSLLKHRVLVNHVVFHQSNKLMSKGVFISLCCTILIFDCWSLPTQASSPYQSSIPHQKASGLSLILCWLTAIPSLWCVDSIIVIQRVECCTVLVEKVGLVWFFCVYCLLGMLSFSCLKYIKICFKEHFASHFQKT